MTEDEIVGWHHQLDGHEFEQGLGVGDGQGSLAYCSPWGHKELDKTEQQSSNNTHIYVYICCCYDDTPVPLPPSASIMSSNPPSSIGPFLSLQASISALASH